MFEAEATIQNEHATAELFKGDSLVLLPALMNELDAIAARWQAEESTARIHVLADPPYEDELHEAAVDDDRFKSLNGIDFEGINETRGFVSRLMVEAATGWLICFSLAEGVRAWRDAQQDAGAKWDTTLAWLKPDASPRFNGQGAARGFECMTTAWCGPGYKTWNAGGKRGVYTHNCNWPGRVSAKDGGHPTEKPLGLMMELVKDFTNPGDLIIDPYMGSGTTGDACLRLGRDFIGIERDPRYFDMAVARLNTVSSQPDFFTAEKWKQPKVPMELPRQAKALTE